MAIMLLENDSLFSGHILPSSTISSSPSTDLTISSSRIFSTSSPRTLELILLWVVGSNLKQSGFGSGSGERIRWSFGLGSGGGILVFWMNWIVVWACSWVMDIGHMRLFRGRLIVCSQGHGCFFV